ncbi:MAG TPA: ribonuclease H-like domain-containing protein, partial [Saprospiraceae bacterium]|nr:ribonuclease H-like domain-containing protein [Saprospiraceae bacterium]
VGFLRKEGNNLVLRLKSFKSDDEREVLEGLTQLLNKGFNDPLNSFLCGHNIKEFDIPFLCRRMMIHSMEIPDIIQVAGKKPWETKQFIDTLELWKFGDNKNYTSLILLAAVLGIASPKDDIDGSEVGNVYWIEKDLDRISTYCQKDVKTVVQVLLKMQGKELLSDDQIEFT